jgi:SRSO17 transposase
MRPLFEQDRTALNAGLFVDGLLGDERRKTGWMRAEAAGDLGPWRQQAVLGRDRWDADALRDLGRDYATEHLADENAVLVSSGSTTTNPDPGTAGIVTSRSSCSPLP